VKHLLDTETLTIIIKALVFNRLYYCSSVWSNTSKKNINKLQSVQHFAARLVRNTRKFDHITPVLSELNWLPVNSTLNLKDAVMTFKCLKGLAPTYLSEKFKQCRSYIHTYILYCVPQRGFSTLIYMEW
jgi:hypothetical protein